METMDAACQPENTTHAGTYADIVKYGKYLSIWDFADPIKGPSIDDFYTENKIRITDMEREGYNLISNVTSQMEIIEKKIRHLDIALTSTTRLQDLTKKEDSLVNIYTFIEKILEPVMDQLKPETQIKLKEITQIVNHELEIFDPAILVWDFGSKVGVKNFFVQHPELTEDRLTEIRSYIATQLADPETRAETQAAISDKLNSIDSIIQGLCDQRNDFNPNPIFLNICFDNVHKFLTEVLPDTQHIGYVNQQKIKDFTELCAIALNRESAPQLGL